MLLRFEFENAFCFLRESVVSMVPSTDRRHPNHVHKPPKEWMTDALRVAAIYGANGHGKSRLVDAMLELKKIAVADDEDHGTELKPFKLPASEPPSPTRFVVNFRTFEAQYEYGLIVLEGKIEQEWLYEKRSRQEVMLFERERPKRKASKAKYDFAFGAKLKRAKSPSNKFNMESYLNFIAAGIDEAKSFLAEATERNVGRLDDAFDWFADTLQIVKADARYGGLHFDAAENKRFRNFLSATISESDTGVTSLRTKRIKASEEALRELRVSKPAQTLERAERLGPEEGLVVGNRDGAVAMIRNDKKGTYISKLVATHRTRKGPVSFDIIEESSGTRRLLDLYPMLFTMTEGDKVYIVDELDRKLHPLLVFEFLDLFMKQKSGQLVFTTHTTFLLDLNLLRRDEIWFVQKDEFGESNIYSLGDFKIRNDLDIRRGYLNGRFGGVPYLPILDEIDTAV